MIHRILTAAALVCLCQCNSVRHTGSAPNPPITKLAVLKNDKIHMSGFQPELVKQVREMGIAAEVVDAAPQDDTPYLTYTANWSWDLAMYLRYFKADLFRGAARIGSVEYKASDFDMGKFGATENKIRAPLRRLLRGE